MGRVTREQAVQEDKKAAPAPRAAGGGGRVSRSQGAPQAAAPQGPPSLLENVGSFVKNLPSNILRVAGAPVEFGGRIAASIGKKAADITAPVVQPILRKTLKPILDKTMTKEQQMALAESLKKNVLESETPAVQLPFQDVPIVGAVRPFKSGREFVSGAVENTINLATLPLGLTGGGAVVKEAGKEVAKKGFGQILKEGAKGQAKRMAVDVPAGFAMGASTQIQNPDATAQDYLTSGLTGAGIAAIAPPAVGAAGKVIKTTTKAVAPKIAGAVESGARQLEDYAGVPHPERVMISSPEELNKPAVMAAKAAEAKTGKTGAGFWKQVEQEKPTVKQQIAEKAAGALRMVQEAPAAIKRSVFDKSAAVEAFQNRAKEAGIEVGDLHEQAHGVRYRAGGKAENRLDDYLGIRNSYGDEWKNVSEMAHYLDELDRLQQGKAITGGRTFQDVSADLADLQSRLTPEQMQTVRRGQADLQKFLNEELEDAVASGRISRQQYLDMKREHPNYLPHEVLDFQDQGMAGMGKSVNSRESGIKAAKGSVREIDTLDNAVVKRLFQNRMLSEKNSVMQNIIDAGIRMGRETAGFVPLRTKENVERRQQVWNQIKTNRQTIKDILADANVTKKYDKATLQRLRVLDAKLQAQEQAFRADLAAYQGEHSADEAWHKELLSEQERRDLRSESYDTAKDRTEIFNQMLDIQGPNFRGGYEAFKQISRNNKWMLDNGVDEPMLARRLSKENYRRLGLSDTADMTEDEVLQRYKGFLERDADLRAERIAENKEPAIKGRINRLNAKQRAAEESMAKTEAAGQSFARKEAESELLAEKLRGLEKSFNEVKASTADLFDDLKRAKDIELKKVDIPEGYEKMSRMVNGVREDWLIPSDLAGALKHLDGDEANRASQWLSNTVAGKLITAPARAIRSLATGINPIFALFSNPVRDIQTVQMTARATPKDFAEGLARMITGGKTDADKELVRLARESGALQGNIYREFDKPADLLRRSLEKNGLISRSLPAKLNAARYVSEAGSAFEEMTRLVVFKRALKDGLTPQDAAKLARNSTVDFGKSGSVIEVVNKVIPFLNARVQGMTNLGKAAAKDPSAFTRRAMWTAAYPAAVLTSYNQKFVDDQGNPTIYNIPENERRKYWIIMVGQSDGRDSKGRPIQIPHYLKIPKGEAQQAISNVVERTLLIGRDKYPTTTLQFMGDMFHDLSPVTESSLIPPGYGQALELMANHSFYQNRSIEPEYVKVAGKWYKSDEVGHQYRVQKNTSAVAKNINDSLDSLLGAELGEMMGYSPAKIDYLIKQGVLTDLIRLGDIGSKEPVPGEPEKGAFEGASQLPVVRSVIGTNAYGQEIKAKEVEAEQTRLKNEGKIELRERARQGAVSGGGRVGRSQSQ